MLLAIRKSGLHRFPASGFRGRVEIWRIRTNGSPPKDLAAIGVFVGISLQISWLVLRTLENLIARVITSPIEFFDWMREDRALSIGSASWRQVGSITAARFQNPSAYEGKPFRFQKSGLILV